jgi:hypothetical protein
MFEITGAEALFTDVSFAGSQHEDDNDSDVAAEITLKIEATNDLLHLLDRELKGSEFRAPNASDSQVDFVVDEKNLPRLRFPKKRYPITWNDKWPGCRLSIHSVIKGSKDFVLEDVEVKNAKYTCKDGGTVLLQIGIRAENVSELDRGRLTSQLKSRRMISIAPPQLELSAPDGEE